MKFSPRFTNSQPSFGVRSSCIVPCLMRRFLTRSFSRLSIQASASLKASAIASCSGKGGQIAFNDFSSGKPILCLVLPVLISIARSLKYLELIYWKTKSLLNLISFTTRRIPSDAIKNLSARCGILQALATGSPIFDKMISPG
ncbi:hypothetical protein D3C78_1099630 [compost metagenome]